VAMTPNTLDLRHTVRRHFLRPGDKNECEKLKATLKEVQVSPNQKIWVCACP